MRGPEIKAKSIQRDTRDERRKGQIGKLLLDFFRVRVGILRAERKKERERERGSGHINGLYFLNSHSSFSSAKQGDDDNNAGGEFERAVTSSLLFW